MANVNATLPLNLTYLEVHLTYMAADPTHPEPNVADPAMTTVDKARLDAKMASTTDCLASIIDSQQTSSIEGSPAEKITDSNAGQPTNVWPKAVDKSSAKLQQAGPASQSIRIHIVVKRNEIGFEWLYSELSSLNDDLGRSKHFKRLLLSISTGIDSANLLTDQGSTTESLRSYHITFRLSNREIGLEKLFKELSAISTPAERNLYVKRLIYKSRTVQSKPLPVAAVQGSESTPEMALAVTGTSTSLSPWSKPAEPMDRGIKNESKEKNNALKRMSSVMSMDNL